MQKNPTSNTPGAQTLATPLPTQPVPTSTSAGRNTDSAAEHRWLEDTSHVETDLQVYHRRHTPGPNPRRSERERKTPSRLGDYYTLFAETESLEPRTYTEAMETSMWRRAIQKEIEAIESNQTWFHTELPTGKRSITAKWVFRLKTSPDASIAPIAKARLVARGFQQRIGVDFDETYAPVVRWTTLRILITLAARRNWTLVQLDVKSAFLNGDLDEEVFLQIPEGFRVKFLALREKLGLVSLTSL
ncbi:hypothetical protein R1sor_001535 [Riccia sorocarpa]|uniref:Reverse transcriptase Ty1/copia-type domain-containing protein n=1 Tax=Riccia sorocarpa TaxID=122646 RepID=A0ABD3GX35_9MARC